MSQKRKTLISEANVLVVTKLGTYRKIVRVSPLPREGRVAKGGIREDGREDIHPGTESLTVSTTVMIQSPVKPGSVSH